MLRKESRFFDISNFKYLDVHRQDSSKSGTESPLRIVELTIRTTGAGNVVLKVLEDGVTLRGDDKHLVLRSISECHASR